MFKRKTISIYAYDFAPTVAITYNVNKEDLVEHYQFWIREDFKYNYELLRIVLDMMTKLESIPKHKLIEKIIYRAYQVSFPIEVLNENYQISVNEFTTKKMSNTIKPYRDFVKTTKQSINTFIKNYIEKGEL